MRVLPFSIAAIFTIALILLFNTKLVLKAPLGKLLSPQHGIWQNAEPVDADFSANLSFDQLKANASVYFDERLVPHVFAKEENDAYFIQGYLHAKFRLWQMDFQTMVAGGRAAEIVGEVALNHDREFRRLGMVFSAENSLKQMEDDPIIKASCDAYTAGVNAYINSLSKSALPIEYKLLGYEPELWSNMRTALFLKYMSYDLSARDNDFELTNARQYFKPEDFLQLYPTIQDSLDPIIPRGTVFSEPSIIPVKPATADSLYFKEPVKVDKLLNPDRSNGSNNWAIAGSKTESGAPILANDPHLGLNLPSLWYEMQLSTPNFNAYGATFPGSPSVIIGFNDSIAFGVTNGGRDVRDYFEIEFKDAARSAYKFNGDWKKTDFRYEVIKVAGKPDYLDTVAYTVFGPVMFDASYSGKRTDNKKNYAVRWKAHDKSNEVLMFNRINRGKNYADYLAAVVNFHTPGQNVVFAAKSGDIAIRTQGEWPAKWHRQGDFIMPGTDSSYMWQGMIPDAETPYQYNPARGFVSSANQRPVDASYPYYLGYEYPTPRGVIINRMLADTNKFTPASVMKMQTDNYNVFAEMARPIFLKNIQQDQLNVEEKKLFDVMAQWNLRHEADSKGATVFTRLWNTFYQDVYKDEFANAPQPILMPFESTLLEGVLRDSAYKFIDDIETPAVETLADFTTASFKKAVALLKELNTGKGEKMEWGAFKATRVNHLARIAPFSRFNLPTGGAGNAINATKEENGPSWRMIVHLTAETEAYGIYPGGQSGNPGSRFYDNFVDDWAAGKYYPLWMMKKEEAKDERVRWVMQFSKKSA